jgi:hypothetical protein
MVQYWSSRSRLLWFIANYSHGEKQKERKLSSAKDELDHFCCESLLIQLVTLHQWKPFLVWLRAQVAAIHIMIKCPYILRSGSLAACLFIFLSTLPSDISTIPLEAAFQGKCVRCLPGAVPISIQKLLHHTNWYFCHDRRHAMASIIHSNCRLPSAIYSFLHLKLFPTPAHYDILLL